MKLFLLSQNINKDWDTYDSCIVAAPDEDSARKIHPSGYRECLADWGTSKDNFLTWVGSDQIDKIQVQYLGEAVDSEFQGVILSSFNAG